jgi:hypothetical protein
MGGEFNPLPAAAFSLGSGFAFNSISGASVCSGQSTASRMQLADITASARVAPIGGCGAPQTARLTQPGGGSMSSKPRKQSRHAHAAPAPPIAGPSSLDRMSCPPSDPLAFLPRFRAEAGGPATAGDRPEGGHGSGCALRALALLFDKLAMQTLLLLSMLRAQQCLGGLEPAHGDRARLRI